MFSLDGKIGRLHYFLILLGSTLIGAVLSVVTIKISKQPGLVYLVCIPLIWIQICASVKRLRDLDMSAWWLLLSLVPIVNVGLGLFMLFKPKKIDANQVEYQISGNRQNLHINKSDSNIILKSTEVGKIANSTDGLATVARAITTNYSASKCEDEVWAEALLEFDSPRRQSGLWARLFAQFNGDENQAKAAYLNHRVIQIQKVLQDEELKRSEIDRQLQIENARKKGLAQLISMKSAHMEKGLCPSCNSVIRMQANHCVHCNADFSDGSAWKPLNRKIEVSETKNQIAIQKLKSAGYECEEIENSWHITLTNTDPDNACDIYVSSSEDLIAVSQLASRRKQLNRWFAGIS